MNYSRRDAKDWAKEHWRGVCNVLMPSFTADLQNLNEKAIRHDVRRNIELGFWGALIVSECGTTIEEYKRFMEIAVDEAKGKQHFLIAGVFDTREQLMDVVKAGEAIGISGLLLGQPNSYYPKDQAELYEYLSSVTSSTKLAVSLFCTAQMNLTRFHQSGYPPEIIVKMVDHENVVAVKYEVGRPGVAGHLEVHKLLRGKNVLLSDPLEANSPLMVEFCEQQWMGTSNYEYWGGAVPKYFDHLLKGEFDRAMEIYWKINPARQARVAIQSTVVGSNLIHRHLWKYQGWLHGFNGGPMRQPIMKLGDVQMRNVREPLLRSGFQLKEEDFASYYIGRNPA